MIGIEFFEQTVFYRIYGTNIILSLVNHKESCKLDIDPHHSAIVDDQWNV